MSEDLARKLHQAIKDNNLTAVDIILQNEAQRADASYTVDNKSALGTAAEGGSCAITELLIKHGCDINVGAAILKSPVFLAARCGHLDLVKLLVKSGANLSLRNAAGNTPFHEACLNGHLDIVKYLMSLPGCDVNDRTNGKETPLHMASLKGHLDIAKELIKAGADLFAVKGGVGPSAIHLATASDRADIIDLLINSGVDVDTAIQENDRTAIHIASISGSVKAAKILISHNCDVNKISIENDEMKSPLLKAVELNKTEIARLLIDAGADLDHGDHYGATPLIMATHFHNLELVYSLVQAGCNVNKKTKNGLTPFRIALQPYPNVWMMNLFIMAGAVVSDHNLSNLKEMSTQKSYFSAEDMLYLVTLARNPFSLKNCCRIAIRSVLKKPVCNSTGNLQLPSQLTDFLHLKELEESKVR
ncbi:ankyrin-3-like [Mizuhopecten yessoensis]|uniref:Ankyrin repeat protein n=1 Tax=Mizuhopecten yessoensis TaxID=6573 RepID=A0A210QMX2_MIZYE|nr:ankyrin-3-like [Mizuhopecten yessoensis]OWF50051.1 Ankyrin repeat protein [Mizuhopecten yessoensis]